MLGDVVHLLRCPTCGAELALDSAVRCPAGHSFDVARQGYVNLVPARGLTDTPAMVEAREAFLAAGHFAPLTGALVEESRATAAPGCVVDVGSGPGHHLARVLDALPDRLGIALDSSKPALRHAARAHPRAGAVGCDAWRPLPVRDGVAAVVLSVFAPRQGAEMARVLAPGGAVVVAAPTAEHLAELVAPLGLLAVPASKDERVEADLAPDLVLVSSRTIEHELALARAEAAALVRMGPSAWHVDEAELSQRLGELPEPMQVTAAVKILRLERRAR